MAPLIRVYHLLFISVKNVRPSEKFPSLFCLPLLPPQLFFPPPPRPPIKCQWPRSRPRRPHLCWQRIQITSFSSVGLCFVKLGACWDPNGISLPFKLQPQTSCQWVRPSLRSSYFPNSLLEPILFDYNMAPTDRNDLPRSGFTSLTHLTFVKRSVSHRLTH